jgi:hypothetical protein
LAPSRINSNNHPHFEYPQFKQVWQLSISTSAWVLHLSHIIEPGGKVRVSVLVEPALTPASAFFF